MSTPLTLAESRLAGHFREIEGILQKCLDGGGGTTIVADWTVPTVVAALVGSGCERTERRRGGYTYVAPLVHLGNGLWAWLGFREEWDRERQYGSTRRYSFRTAGLTIYFGYRNTEHKPQMFRAEWAGWARWNGAELSHQANDAGHPHWQFDAVEGLKEEGQDESIDTLLAVLRSEADDVGPREFSPSRVEAGVVREMVVSQEISRLHFASAATWWKASPEDAHTHVPSAPRDIELWVRRTVDYICNELQRLETG